MALGAFFGEEGSVVVVRRYGGFTLIEVILTLALLGIAVALALPRYDVSLLNKLDAKTTAQRMASDLRLTRQLAIGKATPHYLVIDIDHTYKLYTTSVSPENQIPPTRIIPGTAILGGSSSFKFLPTGALDPSSGQSLTIQIGSSQWSVTIVTATGFVSVSQVS
mgnify:CR=1 FL=1